jgi:DNA (cytosine-5)-methyltransferase 1
VRSERLVPIEGGEPGGMNRHFDKLTGRMAQIGLTQQVELRQMWPTPTTKDHKDGTNVENVPENCLLGRAVKPTPETGALNPTWVEWLQGYPLGWTEDG